MKVIGKIVVELSVQREKFYKIRLVISLNLAPGILGILLFKTE
jgi:hypothetical protein